MKITNKARTALGEHQSRGVNMAYSDADIFHVITCSCGERFEVKYEDGQPLLEPTLHGLLTEHQVKMMEEA